MGVIPKVLREQKLWEKGRGGGKKARRGSNE